MARSDDTGYKIIVATSASIVASFTAVFLRLVCRKLQKIPILTDDYLIISAFIFLTAIAVTSILLVGFGLGTHLNTISTDKASSYRKLSYALMFLYNPAVTFAKLSILFLYRRILPVKQVLLTTSIASSILILWCVAMTCLNLVHCLPIAKAWEPSIAGRCVDSVSYTYASQIPSIIIDFAIIAIPLKVVWDCSLELPQKAMASGVFMVGFLTLAGDIVKTVIMSTTSASTDVTYNQVDIITWINIEPALAILAACLPVLKPLIQPAKCAGSRKESKLCSPRRVDVERGGSPTLLVPQNQQPPFSPNTFGAVVVEPENGISSIGNHDAQRYHSHKSSKSGSFMEI